MLVSFLNVVELPPVTAEALPVVDGQNAGFDEVFALLGAELSVPDDVPEAMILPETVVRDTDGLVGAQEEKPLHHGPVENEFAPVQPQDLQHLPPRNLVEIENMPRKGVSAAQMTEQILSQRMAEHAFSQSSAKIVPLDQVSQAGKPHPLARLADATTMPAEPGDAAVTDGKPATAEAPAPSIRPTVASAEPVRSHHMSTVAPLSMPFSSFADRPARSDDRVGQPDVSSALADRSSKMLPSAITMPIPSNLVLIKDEKIALPSVVFDTGMQGFDLPSQPMVERSSTATMSSPMAVASAPDQHRSVAQQVVIAVTQSGGQITEITLNPEELGRVRMQMTQAVDGGLILHVQAERLDTIDLMRRNSDLLTQEFRALGYGTLTFSFSQQDGNQERGMQPQSQTSPQIDTDPALPAEAEGPFISSKTLDIKL